MANMRRASNASSSAQQRLPVNQRRHRVAPDQRKRVATACNSCNVRRIKCSGERPCLQCRNTSRECQYPLVIEKISIPRAELDDLRARCAQLEACLEQAVPDECRRQDLMTRISSGSVSASSSTSATLESSDGPEEENDGRLLQDPDGAVRYLGSTSGATFLDLIKEFMTTVFPLAWPGSQEQSELTFIGSLGRYQTWDSRPLIVQDVDPFWHPSKTEMAMMMAQLRFFIQDGSGDFPSGGIYYWNGLELSFFDSKMPELTADPHSLRKLALFHAALAMSCQLDAPSESINNDSMRRGETFFARARWLLGNPLDTTLSNIFDIAVLSMMSMYLIEMNRRDAAYIYVSLGMHIAVMNGVHRGWVHNEQCKRSFWTLYIMDRWLSVLNGRPPSIPDEAIKLPLPIDVPGLPPAMGLRAHIELAKISGYIVCNTYRISPWEHHMTSTSARIENALNMLSSWESKLPPDLRMDNEHMSTDRACCELHMNHNQLLILTVRPIFFVAVKKAVAERFINRTFDLGAHPQLVHITTCSDAARRNMAIGRWVRELSQSRKLLSQVLHNIFNAAVILLLNQLLVDTLHETDAMDIRFVIECFDEEAQGDSNYPKDCARVLRDMRSLVQRLRNRNLEDIAWSGTIAGSIAAPVSHIEQQPATTAYHVGFILNQSGPHMDPTQPPVASSELMSQLASWIHYDESNIYNNFSM